MLAALARDGTARLHGKFGARWNHLRGIRHPSQSRSREWTRHGLSPASMLRLPMPNLPMMGWSGIRRSSGLSKISVDECLIGGNPVDRAK
jgi:hypothetical protein